MNTEEKEKRFLTAMIKADLQIVKMESTLKFDPDKITEFIVKYKQRDYVFICRQDDLTGIIADFLGETYISYKKLKITMMTLLSSQ